MSTKIQVPALGESITEGIIAEWLKQPGDYIEEDEAIVELETDKITVEVPSPVSGVIEELFFDVDDTVNVGDVIATVKAGATAGSSGDATPPQENNAAATQPTESSAKSAETPAEQHDALSPAVARLVEENNLDPKTIQATGPNGRLVKGDVLAHLEKKPAAPATKSAPTPAAPKPRAAGEEQVERVRMSKLRQTVAKRLVQAQQEAAMLTTFNEIDMTAVMSIRNKYKDLFTKKYGIKLGFMSFFVKAAIDALKEYPAVNAEIDGTDILYKNFFHIGVAVGGPRGLVVPVVRHADQLSFAETEAEIARLATLARDNKLTLPDLQGGTFTISNGGVYGSMLSTPILNPPQVGILGMHNIVQRPWVVDGKVEVRPIMYLALSYDHRIIDGKEAVSFLVRIKQCLEDPERMLLEI